MAKALKVAAVVAGVAALAVVTGGAGLGLGLSLGTTAFGVSAGTLLAASAVLSTGASLLSPKPKAPAALSGTTDRLTVSINVREPRKIVIGSTAMATDLRDQEWSADQSLLHRFIVVASHRVAAIREVWFDDKLAWTSTGGVQGSFAGYLRITPVLEGSAANAINIGARMGSSRRYTGCAYLYVRYKLTGNGKKGESPFASSIPSRVTIVGDGASVYDPRRDSTVPGGSGPQRANDQSTWAWSASAGRNPALGMLFYLLGWKINGRLAVGKGLPPARIDLASFITAANLCDESVTKAAGGTEPRYRADGVISEGDATAVVLDNFKAAMNGVLDDVDGRLRLSVLHNDLAAPIGDLYTADVLGAFTWQQTLPLNESVNVIRGGFIDPSSASLYQLVDAPEVSVASRDGIERSQTVNHQLVQSPSQAQRLNSQRLQRMIYGGTFAAVFQATAWKFQKGDPIRFTFAPLGWDRKLFRIADMATQVDGKVPMMLREEHVAIYAWDASDKAAVQPAEPTRYDPALWPLVQGITEAGTTAEWDNVSDANGTRPEDNATVGAPVGTPVAGRSAEDVVRQIDELIETYGDTVAAGEFADAAEAAKNAAQVAASNSAAARDLALGAKQGAETARDTASESATTAIGAANASAASSTSASTARLGAEEAAGAAQSASTSATTRAGEAKTFRDEAATSASNASGSASTASQQAGLSAASASAAGGSATAAQSSAGVAATKADEAGASATVASNAKQEAITARDSAQASAGNASGSAGVASGHAAAALDYRNTTATYRDQAAGSANNANLSAQAASNTAAQVDANVGAISQRVDSVEATANGASASASQSASAIAGINGQLASRLILKSVAGNNRAQIELYASANGGAGVDIVGDTTFKGKVIIDNGAIMIAQGIGFGTTSQFLEWVGPSRPLDQCNEANALRYVKTNGDAYFGGSLSAGILKNAITTSSVAYDAAVTLGPFGSNGRPRTYVLSFNYSFYMTTQSGGSFSGAPTAVVELRRNNAQGPLITTLTANGSGYAEAAQPAAGENGFVAVDINGSTTFVDNGGGTPVTLFARLISRNEGNIGGNANGPPTIQQNITIISTE